MSINMCKDTARRPEWGLNPFKCFTIYGHGSHLCNVTSIMLTNLNVLVSTSLHSKFG